MLGAQLRASDKGRGEGGVHAAGGGPIGYAAAEVEELTIGQEEERQRAKKALDQKVDAAIQMIRTVLKSWNGSLRKVFHAIDVDHSSTVDTQEFGAFLQRNLHLDLKPELVAGIMVSEGFPLIPLQDCLFTPELQWQSRGQ